MGRTSEVQAAKELAVQMEAHHNEVMCAVAARRKRAMAAKERPAQASEQLAEVARPADDVTADLVVRIAELAHVARSLLHALEEQAVIPGLFRVAIGNKISFYAGSEAPGSD